MLYVKYASSYTRIMLNMLWEAWRDQDLFKEFQDYASLLVLTIGHSHEEHSEQNPLWAPYLSPGSTLVVSNSLQPHGL